MHPERKRIRLACWDYNSPGVYFLTFCTLGKKSTLSHIVGPGILDGPEVRLTHYGKVVQGTLNTLVQSSPQWKLHHYVIMPNHVHLLLELQKVDTAREGPSGKPGPTGMADDVLDVPRPTNAEVPKFVSSLKRYTNRMCGTQLWQERYYDHVVRNEHDFLRIWKYIDENPAKWTEDRFYIKEDVQ